MQGKIYIGRRSEDFEKSEQPERISRVNLIVDSESMYTAGDDTGRTIEIENPWGTQEMASAILASVSGVSYKPYAARNALLDIAAEIGDGVDVGGIYSTIATCDLNIDALCAANIGAPESDEIDDEYPYVSPGQRSVERKIAYTRALITKTAAEISLRVENLDSEYSELKVTLDGVTVTDLTGTTKIKGSSIETESLNLSGSISFDDLSSDVVNDINDSWAMAQSAMITASGTESKLDSLTYTYGGKTYIDGTQILTGTVTASTLQGGSIYLLNNSAQTKGIITLADAYTTGYAVELESVNGALRLLAGSGSVYIQAGGLTGSYVMLDGADVSIGYANLRPGYANDATCGTATYPWSDIYAVNSTIQTSDRNKKNSINYDLTPYDQFFDSLKPASFKFDDGTSGRTHIGMIAQDVEESIAECALTTKEFAGYVAFYDEELREKGYALRYGEFIALCIEQIQRLKARVAILEDRI